MPNHNFVLELLNKSGPLICTSANISGKKDPSSINQVDPEIKLNVSIIIDDDVIKSGMPSTILDVTNKEPLFLREGTIKYEDIIKKIDEYNNLK